MSRTLGTTPQNPSRQLSEFSTLEAVSRRPIRGGLTAFRAPL